MTFDLHLVQGMKPINRWRRNWREGILMAEDQAYLAVDRPAYRKVIARNKKIAFMR
jgi:hypothetical protein